MLSSRTHDVVSILEHSPLALAITDRASVIKAVSPRLCELLGMGEAALLGRLFPELFGAGGARAADLFENVNDLHAGSENTEIDYVHPIRGPIHLLGSAWPLVDADETAGAIVVHIADVTQQLAESSHLFELAARSRTANTQLILSGVREQKKQEEAERSVLQLNALLGSLNAGVMVLDAAGTPLLMNAQGRRILGLPEAIDADAPDRPNLLDLRFPDGRPVDIEASPFRRAAFGDGFSNLQLKLIRADGSTVSLSFTASRVVGTEAGFGPLFMLLFHDLSEVHRLANLRSETVALISHGLLPPISTIVEYADLLQSELREEGSSPSDSWLQRITEAAQTLSKMTQDLLDSARLEAGGVVLDRRPTDVQALAERIAIRLTSPARTQRVRVVCEVHPPMLDLDVERFDRALTSLIVNGLKFSAADAEVIIAIRCDEYDVWVAVTDHGIGMLPGDIHRIFEPYYRADTGVHGEALGLGLYIARLIIEEHGGHVDVTSVPGVGSTFMITLPLHRADEGSPSTERSQE